MWQLILGPILGTAGGLVQKWFDSREKVADRAHELALMDKEIAMADKRADIEKELAREAADSAAFSSSYQYANESLLPGDVKLNSKQTWLALGVEALTRSIRPVATIWYQLALAGVFSWTAYELSKVNGAMLDPTKMQGMLTEIVYSIIGTAETTLFWWFGIRGTSRRK